MVEVKREGCCALQYRDPVVPHIPFWSKFCVCFARAVLARIKRKERLSFIFCDTFCFEGDSIVSVRL